MKKRKAVRRRLIPSGEATIGPFFPPRYVDAGANDLSQLEDRKADGEVIEIAGTVRQEDGTPLDNLVVEIWQADANGIYRHVADPRHREADTKFFGWGRAATDKEGRYAFRTIRPGAPEGRARHVNVMLMFSGLMRILKTTMFFPGEQANEADPVYRAVPKARRKLLVAREEALGRYRFDLKLRGAHETPFFDD
ncbi:MAG: protocatechuate 3,4-dioxygenase subunit alpha [Betaproteobacteria bacterium]|nr:protocatechuate 3,4-dioxygenase subunit alpha [Betaproteobacteria bacterium]MDH5220288.1 protocatechuate 3,4-dioxygenase subunit alpha [Betaproteobacteria bacterium]MDH5351105.1 protocatechuate 3,4-dioxygenase subunit alpha [Betaproteobacteria bacterium]